LYLVLRLGDLGFRGAFRHALEPTWIGVLFGLEILMSAVVPIALFTLPGVRGQRWAVATGAVFGVSGFVLHRANVGGIAHIPATGEAYLPALTEVMVSVGLVAGMALLFVFFVERFPVWEDAPATPDHFTPPIPDPVSRTYFGGYWFNRVHLAAASWIVGVVVGVAVLELNRGEADMSRAAPVRPARAVAAMRVAKDGKPSSKLRLVGAIRVFTEIPEGFATGLLIDGDRRGTAVVFDHDGHQRRLGGEASCGRCHHRNLRLDRGTPCAVCHADMYRCTDTFNHQQHVEILGVNASCVRCHGEPGAAKTRANATPCLECHETEIIDCFTETRHPCASRAHSGDAACAGCHDSDMIDLGATQANHRSRCGIAPGYRHSMHRLCIGCHCVYQAEVGADDPTMTRCSCCHDDVSSGHDLQHLPTAIVQIAEMGSYRP
jgi:hypothetical protein